MEVPFSLCLSNIIITITIIIIVIQYATLLIRWLGWILAHSGGFIAS
jgi:hypothetical protein